MVAQSASPYFQLTKKLVNMRGNEPELFLTKRELVDSPPQSTVFTGHQTDLRSPQWWQDWKSDVLTDGQEEALEKAIKAKLKEVEDVDPVIEWVFVGINISGEQVFENLNEAGLMMIGDEVFELIKIDTKD
jgi:hypothetical protein